MLGTEKNVPKVFTDIRNSTTSNVPIRYVPPNKNSFYNSLFKLFKRKNDMAPKNIEIEMVNLNSEGKAEGPTLNPKIPPIQPIQPIQPPEEKNKINNNPPIPKSELTSS